MVAKKSDKTIFAERGAIILYRSPNGKAALDVRLDGETLWLNLNQPAGLFDGDTSVISGHLGNVFKSGELEREPVVAFFATVQNEGGRQVERQIEYFNLDAIISVGYRVNSKRGTQFRIRATHVLREQERKLCDLHRAVGPLEKTLAHQAIGLDEAKGLLPVITD